MARHSASVHDSEFITFQLLAFLSFLFPLFLSFLFNANLCSVVFFLSETQHLGLPSFVIGAGTVGVVLSAGEDGLPQVMCWPHCYSAWNLLALVTASLSFTPGIGIGEGCGCGRGQKQDVCSFNHTHSDLQITWPLINGASLCLKCYYV